MTSDIVRSANTDRFLMRFQVSLEQEVQSGVPVEESFGKVWEHTLHEIRLSEAEEGELFQQLITWARRHVRQ